MRPLTDNSKPTQLKSRTLAERTPSVADYVFGPGIDEPLAISRSSLMYYYDVDGLGSVSVLNDASGTAQDSYLNDAWGLARSQTASVANSFTYTAREQGEAGLMYYRARDYNPGIGRFISEDPMRFGQGTNFFSYVKDDPINLEDPTGLEVSCGPYTERIKQQIERVKMRIRSCTKCQKDRERLIEVIEHINIVCVSFYNSQTRGQDAQCGYTPEPYDTMYLEYKVVSAKNGITNPVSIIKNFQPCPCLPALMLHETTHGAFHEKVDHYLTDGEGNITTKNPDQRPNEYEECFNCHNNNL